MKLHEGARRDSRLSRVIRFRGMVGDSVTEAACVCFQSSPHTSAVDL